MADASPADTPVAMEASEAIEVFETPDAPALETAAEESPQPKKRGRPPGSKDKNPGARPSRRLNPPSPEEAPQAPQEEPTSPPEDAQPQPTQPTPRTPRTQPTPRTQRTPPTQPTQPTPPTPRTQPTPPTPRTPTEIGIHEAWQTLSRHLGFEDPQAKQAAKAQWAANLLSKNFH